MSFIPLPDPGELPPEAAKLYERLIATRGRIDGMYLTLLNHPDLLHRVSDLGTYFRFESKTLPADLRELCILHVARSLRAGYEWVKHVGPAREAGVPEQVIADLAAGLEPRGVDAVWADALAAADHALALKSLPDKLQNRLVRALGREGVIEIVALCGFYRMIAGVIACFDVPLPEGTEAPF